jgi:hypothetical protein
MDCKRARATSSGLGSAKEKGTNGVAEEEASFAPEAISHPSPPLPEEEASSEAEATASDSSEDSVNDMRDMSAAKESSIEEEEEDFFFCCCSRSN